MPLTMRMGQGAVSEPTDDEATLFAPRDLKPPSARRCPTCSQAFSGHARFCPFDGDPLVDAPDWNPAADALIGKVVDGRYRVLSVLGEGGMGTVYEVRHTTLDRRFALKVLRRDIAENKELTARFFQEAKAAASIGHPNIIAVSDFGELAADQSPRGGRVPYFVMELLTGVTLAELLRAEKTLEPRRAAALLVQCASALEAAHAAGVLHRDLKPDNVFLIESSGREFVKLLDFGVAKIAGVGRLTRAGMVFGTPHYMSPEQAAGEVVDRRADIYALGVIMYECFAGRVPFEADTYMGVLTQHMFAQPTPIESATPDPRSLGALGPIAMRCLAKNPADRFESMGEVAEAIALALADPAKAAGRMQSEPPAPSLRLREPNRPSRSRSDPEIPMSSPPWRALLAVGALAAVVAAGFGVRAHLAGSRATSESTAPASASPAPAGEPSAQVVVAGTPADSAMVPVAPAPATAAPPPPTSTAAPRKAGGSTKPARPGAKPGKRGGEVVDPWAN